MNVLTKLALAGICLLAASSLYAQEPADTIKVIDNAKSVVVTKIGGKTSVVAEICDSSERNNYYVYDVEVSPSGKDDDLEFDDSWELNLPFVPKDSRKNRAGSRRLVREITGFEHIYWGWRFNYNGRVGVKNCFETGVRQLVGVRWSRGSRCPSFSIGAGFGMMRLLAQDGYAYGKTGDAVMAAPLEAGVRADRSRLDVWRIHVPVLMSVPMGAWWKFCVGGVLNLNTYAGAVTRIHDGDLRENIKYKGLQQNLLTPDLFASLTVGGVGVYASWSPFPLFKGNFGPHLKGWSIGVEIAGF